QRLGRAHLGAERQLALGQPVGAVYLVLFLGVVGLGTAGAEGAFVHLPAAAEIADLRILRRAERTGVEAVAAADAQVLGMQHHALVGPVEAVHRADGGAGRILAMHAGHRDGALALLAVIQRDDAATVDAPRNLMLVLAGGDAGVAFDAALGVAEEFHTGHDLFSPRLRLCRLDAAQRDFGFLHVGDRVVAVAGDLVRAFAEHDR